MPADYDTTQKACDVKIGYRKYEVTAAWVFDTATTDPGKTDFYAQNAIVDFERFLLPAEDAYKSAN